MISINDTIERPKAAPTYRVRTEAMAAAVFELGPHARNGFEFLTFKCDGLWRWRSTDEVRPMSAAEIKARGGKRALITQQGTTMVTPLAKPPVRGNAAKAQMAVPARTLTSDAPTALARHPVDELAMALLSMLLDGSLSIGQ